MALVTPFDDQGEVDYAALERLVDYVINGGVDYLVAMGTTGETPTLTTDDRRGVLDCVRDCNNGRKPIVVGIGSNDTRHVVEMIDQTDLTDIEAILSVTPFYNRPSQRGIFEHYKFISERSPLPLILYNVPSRTGVNMTADTTLRIARELPNVMAIKEASGQIDQIERIIRERPEGFGVISGDDSMALPLIKAGGDGLISVAGNAFPAYFERLIREQFAANYTLTDELFARILPTVKMLFAEGNPSGVKAALAIQGIIRNNLRLPLVAVSDELYGRMAAAIADGGFSGN